MTKQEMNRVIQICELFEDWENVEKIPANDIYIVFSELLDAIAKDLNKDKLSFNSETVNYIECLTTIYIKGELYE